jgi:transposase
MGESSFYLYKDWSAYTWGVEREEMTSQDISRLMKKLGEMDRERELFWKQWSRRHGSGRNLVFDITSISSYSDSIDMLEWGYNRDREILPQINIGLAMSETSMLPLGYRIYPGSIPDIKVIKNLLEYFKSLKIRHSRIVLDRGFFSTGNMLSLRKHGFSFIIPMPFTSKKAREILKNSEKSLSSPMNVIQYEERFIAHVSKALNTCGVRCEGHIFNDEKRAASEKENLMRKIIMVEKELSGTRCKNIDEAQESVERLAPKCSKYFDIKLNDGVIELKRKKKELEERILRMGRMIILCGDKGLSPEDILTDYYRKDFLEKFFDTYKNEIGQKRLRIQSDDAMNGRIFIAMNALILRGALAGRIRQSSELRNKITIPEILNKLKLLRSVEFSDGKIRTSEMTASHKKLFNELNVKEPPVEFV